MSSGRSTSASQERVEEVEGSVVGTGIQRKQGQLTEFVGSSVLIATAVKRTGEREVIGVDVGPAEDLEFWRAFLRQLVTRGLRGVRLVTSDSHLGLKQAVGGGLRSIGAGAEWLALGAEDDDGSQRQDTRQYHQRGRQQ